ncbi:MAG: exosortase/archaeosortase family protein [Sedimentisphaerales bacterium]|nr:exosortase/archaeosortase family protein [Sedimentisphaerales bacterium]
MGKYPCSVPGQGTANPGLQSWSGLGLHRWIKIALVGGLLCFLFRPELERIVRLWVTDPSWSHGFLIPLFSLYFVNQRRGDILALRYAGDPLTDLMHARRPGRLLPGQTRPNYLGLVLLLGAMGFYTFNLVSPSGYAYLRALCVVAALGAVVLFLGGWALLRCTWLPIAYLVFAIPLPRRYYVGLTMPLRQIATTVATVLLNLVGGVEATANGVVIDVVYNGQPLEPALNVAEACSGMRLLMAFLALGVAMAYLHERPIWQRLVLLLSTVPIAVFCNIVRVSATGFIYVLCHPKYTQGIYHDGLGLAMLPLAFALYGFLAWFMSSLFVEEPGDAPGENMIVRRRTVK